MTQPNTNNEPRRHKRRDFRQPGSELKLVLIVVAKNRGGSEHPHFGGEAFSPARKIRKKFELVI